MTDRAAFEAETPKIEVTSVMLEAARDVLRTYSISIDFLETTDQESFQFLFTEVYKAMICASK
jgi:hypothetical protein